MTLMLAFLAVLSIGANVPMYYMLRSPRHALMKKLRVPVVVAPVTSFTHDEWRGMY